MVGSTPTSFRQLLISAVALDLTVHTLRLEYRAHRAISFPTPLPANALRGALGFLVPPELFAPRSIAGPSGLRDTPRPYVFRARHLAGLSIAPHADFHFTVHFFTSNPAPLLDAFRRLDSLLGAPLELLSHTQDNRLLSLAPLPDAPPRIAIEFLTPTELKRDFDFTGLLATLRDRVSNLRAAYGPGPLDIDHRALAERARAVRLLNSELHPVRAARTSSRTGHTHPIGGLVGRVVYEGDFREFLPYLDAAAFTGAGRQASWGKGEILWRTID